MTQGCSGSAECTRFISVIRFWRSKEGSFQWPGSWLFPTIAVRGDSFVQISDAPKHIRLRYIRCCSIWVIAVSVPPCGVVSGVVLRVAADTWRQNLSGDRSACGSKRRSGILQYSHIFSHNHRNHPHTSHMSIAVKWSCAHCVCGVYVACDFLIFFVECISY